MLQSPSQANFDPHNTQHLEQFAHFLEKGKWECSCPFVLEAPFLSVPHMIERKLSLQWLKQNAVIPPLN